MDNNLLEPPKRRLEYFGKRSFAAAAPVLWNDLPLHIKQSPSVDIFKSRIKTRLFQLAYFIWLCKCMYVYFMLSIMNRLGLTRSYVTCTFASGLVSKGQISIWHICLILKLALYKYHIIIIIILLSLYQTHYNKNQQYISLWPSNAISQQSSGSTLVEVMACCLTAPSHYLNQRWIIINEVQWYASDGNLTTKQKINCESLKLAWKLLI